MNYTIFNYKGDVISESVSQEELDIMIESNEFNCFKSGELVYDVFTKEALEITDEEIELDDVFQNTRVYKRIVEISE